MKMSILPSKLLEKLIASLPKLGENIPKNVSSLNGFRFYKLEFSF